jgi:hypothetical protein
MTYINLLRIKDDIKQVKKIPDELLRNILINKNYDRRLV